MIYEHLYYELVITKAYNSMYFLPFIRLTQYTESARVHCPSIISIFVLFIHFASAEL